MRGYEAAWQKAARDVADRKMPGLQLRCPKCHRRGSLFSKWVKGVPVKPVFVVHANGNGHLAACALDVQQAASARAKITITSRDTRRLLRMGTPYVLFSGGKDSLCLLEYMRRLGKNEGVDITAIHADTTAGFPEVEDFVKEVCENLRVPLVVVRPTHDYFDVAKRWGIPGVRSRWCCSTLKIDPIRRYLSEVHGDKVIFDGIRAAESGTRATYTPVWYHPSFRCVSVSPIFRWSDAKVAGYLKRHRLPVSPAASLGTSAECWCGAYKCRSDFEALLDVHPEIFDKLVEVEKAQRGKFTYVYEDGQQIPLKSLRNQGKTRKPASLRKSRRMATKT